MNASPEIARRGIMLVVSSPSGAGKTTLTRNLLEQEENVSLSISVTTRARRASEIDGVHYHFIPRRRFETMRDADELLEWAEVHGNYYGTPREPVETALAAGRDMLFDIDWQGTQQLYAKMRADVVSVFVLPPSASELKARLERRAEDIRRRHHPPPAQRGGRDPALERIRLRPGQSRPRQELRAPARDPDRRASEARAEAEPAGLRVRAARRPAQDRLIAATRRPFDDHGSRRVDRIVK